MQKKYPHLAARAMMPFHEIILQKRVKREREKKKGQINTKIGGKSIKKGKIYIKNKRRKKMRKGIEFSV